MESTNPTGNYNQYPVYLGQWVNWSRGPVFGATLTMTRSNGNLLIAFTAFFVAFITPRVWRIICFILHRLYASPKPRDALHYQRQVILRNSASPEVSFWTFSQLLWAWRRRLPKKQDALVRVLPILLCAVVCMCAFTLAGGFSSHVSTAIGNEVLLDGSNCAVRIPTFPLSPELDALKTRDLTRQLENAVNYAQQCYESDQAIQGTSSMFDCNPFRVSKLPVDINKKAACPFNETICYSSDSNLVLDTGYIDSHAHLGINAPADERMLYRHVYSCAPLKTRGYSLNHTSPRDGNLTSYYYGPIIKGSSSNRTSDPSWATFGTKRADEQYPQKGGDPALGTYFTLNTKAHAETLRSFTYNFTNEEFGSDFIPIPELSKPDGDVSIIFLVGNGVITLGMNNDSWFRASVPLYQMSGPQWTEKIYAYRPEEAASPLACVGQHQYCRNTKDNCGQLASDYDAIMSALPVFNLSVADWALTESNPASWQARNSGKDRANRFKWFSMILSNLPAHTAGTQIYMGGAGLLSQQTVINGLQYESYQDQWKQDVIHWFSTWLAVLQTAFVDAAGGVRLQAAELFSASYPPQDEYMQKMCYNQVTNHR